MASFHRSGFSDYLSDWRAIIGRGDRATALDPAQQRQHAHAYLDHLPAEQLSAVRALLESMLSPLERKLALAPIDDEPLTPEEAAAIQAGIASLGRNGGVPMEEVVGDFGLTMDDFRKMAETPLPEEPNQ